MYYHYKNDIEIKKAPTGRAKCRKCKEFILKDSMKLLLLSFIDICHNHKIHTVPYQRSICGKCAPEYLSNHKKLKFSAEDFAVRAENKREEKMNILKGNFKQEIRFINDIEWKIKDLENPIK